jgi:dTDP-4-dehydrorhamnose reductase
MRVLVLGATGQVGYHLRLLLPSAIFWDRARIDLAHADPLEQAVLALRPSAILNAAAYTAVDRAETEAALAWRVNAEAPAALARAARQLDVPLVHLSTDYVFDGAAASAYRETDAVAPINVYGRTKLAGELAVASLCQRYWMLRTSWVFSEHGANFVKTMLRLARERDTLTVVDDQHGCPTYAGDLAAIMIALVNKPGIALPYGLYHVAGGVPTTWRRFAERIVVRAQAAGLLKQVPRVLPISTHDYPTPARRPMNSILAAAPALQQATGVNPDWQAGLDRMLSRLPVPQV